MQAPLGVVGEMERAHDAMCIGERGLHGMDAEDQRLPVVVAGGSMPFRGMLAVAVGHGAGGFPWSWSRWSVKPSTPRHTCRFCG